jgi:hypothetical protein
MRKICVVAGVAFEKYNHCPSLEYDAALIAAGKD